MADLLAIISKAQFEAAHRTAKRGDALGFTEYVSSHAALEPLRSGGSLFLVTVRPPDERLWLLAELVDPKHDGKAWKSKPSASVVKDITALIPKLEFSSGKGLAPKKGALGMSLQTPRLLTAKDSALLRGKAASAPAPSKVEAPPVPERTRAPLNLSEVLEEWRATRAPELEALIDTLSRHHARAYPSLDPDAADFDDVWTARIAEVTAESLSHLLPGLWSDPRGSIPMRLRKLLDRGADPRLGAALLKMIDDPPLTASSNFSAWTLLFKALPTMVDTRASKRLKTRASKKGGDSQFWPKLTGWIETALEQLAPPATLSKDQLASVAKRQKQAEALLAGPPPLAAAKAEKPAPTTLPLQGSPREVLERVVQEVSNGKLAAALEPLRLYWELTLEPSAAELLARLGKAASAAQPRFDEGKPAAIHAGWMKAGKRFEAAQVTPLLDALIAGTLADSEERLELMLTWPADPRVAAAMMGLIDSNIGARPQLWKRTYELLVRNADPRFIKTLQENAKRLESAALFDRNRAERPHASRTIVDYVEAASRGRKPSADEAALLEKAGALLTSLAVKAKAAKKPDEELGLLRAILAAPADETARLVYADFLTERGDVRGEFINLSLALARGEKVKAKFEAFGKKHQRLIVGNLRGIALDGPGGLPDEASLGYSEDERTEAEWRELAEDLRWVTVRKLSLSKEAPKTAAAVLALAPLYGLKELLEVTGAQLSQAAARDFPWALRRISLLDYALDATVGPRAFPHLEELKLASWEPSTPEFWSGPLIHAVERITMGNKNSYGDVPVDDLIVNAPKLSKLKTVEVRTAAIDLDVAKSGDGRADATLVVKSLPSFDDEDFVTILERLTRIPSSAVRRFTVVESGKARFRVMELVKEATRHLPS